MVGDDDDGACCWGEATFDIAQVSIELGGGEHSR